MRVVGDYKPVIVHSTFFLAAHLGAKNATRADSQKRSEVHVCIRAVNIFSK